MIVAKALRFLRSMPASWERISHHPHRVSLKMHSVSAISVEKRCGNLGKMCSSPPPPPQCRPPLRRTNTLLGTVWGWAARSNFAIFFQSTSNGDRRISSINSTIQKHPNIHPLGGTARRVKPGDEVTGSLGG